MLFGLVDNARVDRRLYIFVATAAGVAAMLFGYIDDWTESYGFPLQVSARLLALGKYPDG